MTGIDWTKPNISFDELMNTFGGNASHSQKQEVLEHAGNLTRLFNAKKDEETAIQIYLKALEDDDLVVKQIALGSIAVYLGHRIELLEPVKEFLEHESDDVRVEAVHALGSIRTNESLMLIVDSLGDESEKVRWCATVKIAQFGRCRVQKPWLMELRSVEPERFENEILKSIQKNENSFPEVVNGLEQMIEMFGNSSVRTRRGILKTLGCIDDPRTINPLLKGLVDDSAEVRGAAAYSLGTKAEKSAVNSLIDSLKDESPHVRFISAEALGIINDKRAIQPLIDASNAEDVYNKKAMKLIIIHLSK